MNNFNYTEKTEITKTLIEEVIANINGDITEIRTVIDKIKSGELQKFNRTPQQLETQIIIRKQYLAIAKFALGVLDEHIEEDENE